MRFGYGIGLIQDYSFKGRIEALIKNGVNSVFIDDYSICHNLNDRVELNRLINIINLGDEVLIPSLVDFGFNETELVELIKLFANKNAKIFFVEDGLKIGGLGISYEIAITMMNAWSRFAAKKTTLIFKKGEPATRGRKIKLTKAEKISVMERFYLHNVKAKALEEEYGISRTTLWRAINCKSIEIERNEILIKRNLLESQKLKEKKDLISAP